jgi:hypothetical protein
MKTLGHLWTLLVLVGMCAHRLIGQTSVLFDFDTGVPPLTLKGAISGVNPTYQTVSNFRAGFLAASGTLSFQSATSFAGEGLPKPPESSGMTNLFIYAGGASNVLEIRFDHLVSSISLNFATPDLLSAGGEPTMVTLVSLTNGPAFPPSDGVTNLGTFVDQIYAADVLTLTPAEPFAAARVVIPGGQAAPTSYFLIDNVDVTLSSDTRVLVTGVASPSAGGSITGGGILPAGTSTTLVASAQPGYAFTSWSENGTAFGTNASLTLSSNSNRWINANFSRLYTISATASPASGGKVNGAGIFMAGAPVSLIATPAAGYSFVSWTEKGTVVSTSPSYTFTATAGRSLVANFKPGVSVSLSASPVSGGFVFGSGLYASGANAIVTASAYPGYAFVSWTEGGMVVSRDAVYAFVVTGPRALVANYVAAPRYTISTLASPSTGGITTGGGTFSPGDGVTLSAIPASGYKFVSWTVNSGFVPVIVSTNAVYSFAVSGSLTITANFVPGAAADYVVGVSENSPGGSVVGAGTYASGVAATVIATPYANWSFVGWYEGTNLLTLSPSYSFTVRSNRNLKAVFWPLLTIGMETVDSVKLSWPAAAVGFSLQSSSSLTGAAWSNVSSAPVVSAGMNEVIVTADMATELFRVIQP